MATKAKRTVSPSHKAAMKAGRAQSRSIATYLDALEAHKPKRGRKRTPESVNRRLDAIDKQLAGASQVKRLALIQERINLVQEKNKMGAKVDISAYEKDFVKTAKAYGERKGISYAAWRTLGITPAILKRAGITRGNSG